MWSQHINPECHGVKDVLEAHQSGYKSGGVDTLHLYVEMLFRNKFQSIDDPVT